MVEEDPVADKHLVTHEIARLIIADSPPGRGFAGRLGQIIDAEDTGFRFHQPVIHDSAAQKNRVPVYRNSIGLPDFSKTSKVARIRS